MPHLVILSGEPSSWRGLLHKASSKMGFSPEDVIRRTAESWLNALADNGSPDIFSERSVILLDVVEELGPLPQSMHAMLEGPEARSIILVPLEQVHKDLAPLVSHGKVSVFKDDPIPRFGDHRLRWISQRAVEEGVRLSPQAVALISESFEDPQEMVGEIRKLGLLNRMASLDDVAALCVGDGERRLVSFLDDLCLARRHDAIAGLELLKRRDDLFPVISALHNRFRLAFYVSRFGEPWVQSSLSPRPYALKMAARAAVLYPKDALSNFLRALIELNLYEKMGLGSGWARLDLGIFHLLESAKS